MAATRQDTYTRQDGRGGGQQGRQGEEDDVPVPGAGGGRAGLHQHTGGVGAAWWGEAAEAEGSNPGTSSCLSLY